MEISVILPCRNEQASLGECIQQVHDTLNGCDYEVIVSDCSTDTSPLIALEKGALLVTHPPGYGNAYLAGFKAASGDVIVMADSDGTYDLRDIPRFTREIKKGYDLVLGSRFMGCIHEDAMPAHHRYLGNPLLTKTLNTLFGGKISDAHTGYRAITREALEGLELKAQGMEFASEMIVEAVRNNLRVREIPIDYHPRRGESKLHSLKDGWRHISFMLNARVANQK